VTDAADDAAHPTDVDQLERENARLARRVRRLEETLVQLEEIRDANAHVLDRLVADLEAERQRSRDLLLNVLPESIVERLTGGETEIADGHDRVAVLFSDFVGFTGIASALEPRELVAHLNAFFTDFDAAAQRHDVEKIKTIGDAYLAVAGLTASDRDPVASIADLALDILAIVGRAGPPWAVRVGLHVGPAVAGVIGTHKFAYDVWGDTVNVASRLESTSEAARIHVSDEVAQALASRYDFAPRGRVELKGKGSPETFYLTGRHSTAAPDPGPTLPG
jgi:class 3 adenylate cyclase